MEIQAQNVTVPDKSFAAPTDRRSAPPRLPAADSGNSGAETGSTGTSRPSARRAIIVERASRVPVETPIGYADRLPGGQTARLARAQPVMAGALVGSSVRSLDGRAIGTVSETYGFNNQMLQVSVATHGSFDETRRTIFLQMALRDIPGKTIRLNHDLATLSRLYGK